MKKQLIFIFVTIFLIGIVSATLSFSDYKEFTKGDLEYGKVTIMKGNILLPDTKQSEITLLKNTPACSDDCYAEGTITLYLDGKLFDSVRFKDMITNSFKAINSNKFYIQDGTKKVEYYKTETSCVKDEKAINGTSCTQKQVLDYTSDEPNWIEYGWNNYKAGTYNWRLEGSKNPTEVIDWLGTWNGIEVNEWITWGVAITYAHGKNMVSTSAENYLQVGMEIQVPVVSQLLNYTLEGSGSNPTDCDLLLNNLARLYTTPITGLDCIFNYTLTAGTKYILSARSNSAFKIKYGGGTIPPILNQTEVLWTEGYANNATTGGFQGISNVTIQVGTEDVITMSLNQPANALKSTNKSIIFNCSAIGEGNILGVTNLTLFIDSISNYSLYNTTAKENISLQTTLSLTEGNHNWTCFAENNNTNSTASLRTFGVDSVYPLFSYINSPNGSQGIQTGSYNVTLNYSVHDLNIDKVWWNISYSGTKNYITPNQTLTNVTINQGNHTIYVYANDTYGNINYTSSNFWSDNSNNLTLCSGTGVPFSNFTFKDEVSDTFINASITSATFIYWVTGESNKTLTYINTTQNPSYAFCFDTPFSNVNIVSTIQYKQGTAYPQRTWTQGTTVYSNNTINNTLYLLSSNDGLYVTFQVINLAEQPISGVLVNVTQGGNLVGTGTTGDDGSTTFWLNPDLSHTFTFYKSGYDIFVTTLNPTQSAYTISLGGAVTVPVIYTHGIDFLIKPAEDFLDNNTVYNFNYTISSSYWNLDAFGYSLYYGNNSLIISQVSTSSTGGFLSSGVNTLNSTAIYMIYYYTVNGTNMTYPARTWIIQSTTGRDFSIFHFFEDLDAYTSIGMFGFDNFGRALLAVLILILVGGTLSYRYGIASEPAVMGILFGVVLFLDSVGFIPERIPLAGINSIPHFITFAVFILMFVMIIREESK